MDKNKLKREIVSCLQNEKEIERIIIFGSFSKKEQPNDLDIAVVQNSKENYLTLALKYRKLIRSVSKQIPVDIFPIVPNSDNDFYRNQIEPGEEIYARGN